MRSLRTWSAFLTISTLLASCSHRGSVAGGSDPTDRLIREAAASLAPDLKGRIVVLEPTPAGLPEHVGDFGRYVSRVVSDELVSRSKRRYAVLEREELAKIFKDSLIFEEGRDLLEKLRNSAGMDTLVSGDYGPHNGALWLRLTATDARSGRIVGSRRLLLPTAMPVSPRPKPSNTSAAPAPAVRPVKADTAPSRRWHRLSPSGSSAGLISHSAIFDAKSGTIIQFGGFHYGIQGISEPFSDSTWVLDGIADEAVRWTEHARPADGPTSRVGHTATLDSKRGRMLVVGGSRPNQPPAIAETWALSLTPSPTRWNRINTTGLAGAARSEHAAFFDPQADSLFVFGGRTGDHAPDSAVWRLRFTADAAGRWEEIATRGTSPPGRLGAFVAYDEAADRLFVFGGCSGTTALNDSWILEPVSRGTTVPEWKPIRTNESPSARCSGGGGYLTAAKSFFIVGGAGRPDDVILDDAWVLAGGAGRPWSWRKAGGVSGFHRRLFASGLDQTRERFYVLGGQTVPGEAAVSDAWWLDVSNLGR